MISDSFTVPQKLLLAALQARKRSATFSAEDLVVEAWKMFPDTFGLAGHSDQYPDSNRVLTNIMGTKGMRGKGWLRKVGEKQYRLTSAGLTDGETLLRREGPGVAQSEERRLLRAELDRNSSVALERLVETGAARKALSQSPEKITFHDACGFWDITARSNANTLNARMAETTVLLDRIKELFANQSDPDGLKLAHGTVTKTQIQMLIDLHLEMQEMFKTELDIIRRRIDERFERKRRPF